jgi:nitroreductase
MKRQIVRLARLIVPSWLWDYGRGLGVKSRLSRNFSYDQARYLKWSGLPVHDPSRVNLRSMITMDYHRIEKGLSLKSPRLGFGKATVEALIRNVSQYLDRFGVDNHIIVAVNVLNEYCVFNRDVGSQMEPICKQIDELKLRVAGSGHCEPRGGVFELTRDQIHSASMKDLRAFFATRHSIRHFGGEPVPLDSIEQAIGMSTKTPSVCNRQAWRVYCFSDPEKKLSVLSHQNGNRGFGDQASWVLVVTCDLSHFVSVGERNQAWIDGGMFAMSLLYALHSLGLGACPLNWSMEKESDSALRQAAKIQDQDAIIMLIAVGQLPETLRVAQSARKRLDEVMVLDDSSSQVAFRDRDQLRDRISVAAASGGEIPPAAQCD